MTLRRTQGRRRQVHSMTAAIAMGAFIAAAALIMAIIAGAGSG